VRGINVHARQVVDGRDRRQLERLCRYVTRPPIAQDRLSVRSDGTLELELKSVWRDGTRAIVLSPEDLVLRLIAAIPPPRWHMVRYFGVLSSHSRFRKEVVPRSPPDPAALRPPPAAGDLLEPSPATHRCPNSQRNSVGASVAARRDPGRWAQRAPWWRPQPDVIGNRRR
jgi:hypothetical protein